MKKILILGLLIATFLIVGCYGTQTVAPSAPTTTGEGATMKVPAPGNEDVEEMIVVEGEQEIEEGTPVVDTRSEEQPISKVKEFTMIAKQWEFVPNIIIVNLGDTVKITVTSADVTHGFNLPDFGVNERLNPGKPVQIEFVADKKGTFPFACNIPCGRGHGGMNGKLIVE